MVNISILVMLTEKKSQPRQKIIITAFLIALAVSVYVWGNKEIKNIKNQFNSKKLMDIIAVQGNIDQSLKWEKSLQKEIITRYLDLTDKLNPNKKLVIWPETAIPFVYGLNKEITEFFKEKSTDKNYFLVTGFPSFDWDENNQMVYTNSAGLFYNGELIKKYDKTHLVPFGEYVPLKKLLFFVNKLVQAAGDFKAGTEHTIFKYNDSKFGILICYEAIFPEISRSYKEKGANYLINITNDAWFGNSPAPYQHLAMAKFRAVENEVYLVRVANTGISAIIAPWGDTDYKTNLFTTNVFESKIRY